MTQEEFADLVGRDPAIGRPLQQALAAARRQTYTTGIEVAAAAVMFPLVSFVVQQIGLPWLYEARRYSELWRARFHDWIDTEYAQTGRDPDEIEKAGDALRLELAKVTDPGVKAAWERLARMLAK